LDVVERNFFRLLRAGAFATEEQIEPLSAWKWKRLYQLSQMHGVTPWVNDGVERCRSQFFTNLIPDSVAKLLQKGTPKESDETEDSNTMLTSDHLTNPLLNHKLQDILDDEHSSTETRHLLLLILGTARFVMNAGIPVKRITEMGLFLRQSANRIDFLQLQTWIHRLRLDTMAQLSAVMLVKLLHFKPEELPFMKPSTEQQMEHCVKDMLQQKNSHAEEWYFSQGKDIFVHTSNSSAMLWQVRRSASNFKYFPAESVTNFMASFAHSLSHIEE
jgi:hypothetical protein